MKKIVLLTLYVVLSASTFAQKKDSGVMATALPVRLDSVSNHIGKLVTVTGKVFGVKETGKVAFINLGAAFPNAVLTLFVPAESLNNFKDVLLSSYDGKEITVYGKVDLYRNKPQIVLQYPEQVVIKQ